jgi:hypothetical protein
MPCPFCGDSGELLVARIAEMVTVTESVSAGLGATVTPASWGGKWQEVETSLSSLVDIYEGRASSSREDAENSVCVFFRVCHELADALRADAAVPEATWRGAFTDPDLLFAADFNNTKKHGGRDSGKTQVKVSQTWEWDGGKRYTVDLERTPSGSPPTTHDALEAARTARDAWATRLRGNGLIA